MMSTPEIFVCITSIKVCLNYILLFNREGESERTLFTHCQLKGAVYQAVASLAD